MVIFPCVLLWLVLTGKMPGNKFSVRILDTELVVVQGGERLADNTVNIIIDIVFLEQNAQLSYQSPHYGG